MPINTKIILRAAALVGALTVLGGVAVSAVKVSGPIADSGPLPVPSRAEVNTEIAGLTQELRVLQKADEEHARQDAARDRLLAATRQQELEGLLFTAPKSSPRAYICNLIDQIDTARAVNHLPPMQPCR